METTNGCRTHFRGDWEHAPDAGYCTCSDRPANDYVPDNPLYAEPAQGTFDEDLNLVENVRGLLENEASFTTIARYVASFDEEVGDPGATFALIAILKGNDDDKAIADGVEALRKG
jgi:hypothetical protein